MMIDLTKAAAKRGLEIHLGKTKILTNEIHEPVKFVRICGERIDILAYDGFTDYLGRRLCLGNLHTSCDFKWK